MSDGQFDLDASIEQAADYFRAKHPVDSSPGKRIQEAFDRVKRDANARDTIARARGPKLPIRDNPSFWTPPGR